MRNLRLIENKEAIGTRAGPSLCSDDRSTSHDADSTALKPSLTRNTKDEINSSLDVTSPIKLTP